MLLTSIVCRREKSSSEPAQEIKKFTTLDGVERDLARGRFADLRLGICRSLLAGVMGGANSEVNSGDTFHPCWRVPISIRPFHSPHGKTAGAP